MMLARAFLSGCLFLGLVSPVGADIVSPPPPSVGRAIKTAAIVNGMLVLVYADGTEATIGRVVGPPGEKGDSVVGPKGDKGDTGSASAVPGPQGPKGDTGAASTIPGPKGDPGAASTAPGPKGDKGDPGAASTIPGPKGDKGDSGTASTIPGPKGDKGDTGAASTVAGPKGDKGDPGASAARCAKKLSTLPDGTFTWPITSCGLTAPLVSADVEATGARDFVATLTAVSASTVTDRVRRSRTLPATLLNLLNLQSYDPFEAPGIVTVHLTAQEATP